LTTAVAVNTGVLAHAGSLRYNWKVMVPVGGAGVPVLGGDSVAVSEIVGPGPEATVVIEAGARATVTTCPVALQGVLAGALLASPL
jgi:hypothetical protein